MSDPRADELPNGWTSAPFGELTCEAVQSLGPTSDEPFVYVDISSINNQTKRIESPKRLQPDKAPSRAKQNLKSGDVLVSMTRPNLNSVAQVTEEFEGSVGSTGFHVLRPVLMSSPWMFHAVQTSRFVADMSALVQGALYPAVRPKDIEAWLCPVPPKAEQERIADTLDELLSDLDAGVAALERVQKKLTHYRAAVLKAAVDGDLTADWRAQHPDAEPASELLPRILTERRRRWEEDQLRKFQEVGKEPPKGWKAKYQEPTAPDITSLPLLPEGWCWTTTRALCCFVTSGSRGWAAYYSNIGPLFLRIGNLDHESTRLDLTKLQHVSPPVGTEGLRTRVQPQDILISITADVGMVGLVQDDIGEAYINQHIALARMVTAINRAYVAWYLSSPSGGQLQFKNLQRGATKVGLGLDDIQAVLVPLPPLAEQEAIVEAVEAQLSVVDHLEADIAAKLKSAQGLRQSILRHAFTGQLVPQDPNDEPAAELLKRIATEREERARMAANARLASKSARKKFTPVAKKAPRKRANSLA